MDGEYTSDIQAHATAHGFDVSADDLKTWREVEAIKYLGTVPNPSGRRGRTGLYAAGTAERVVELKRRLIGGDLTSALWNLWLDGSDIADRWTRDRVVGAAEVLDAYAKNGRKVGFIPSGAAFSDNLIDELEKRPRLSGPAALTRKLVGAKRFDTLLFRLTSIAVFGREIPTRPHDGNAQADIEYEHATLVSGLGVDRLLKDKIAGKREGGGPLEVVFILNKIARRLRGRCIADEVRKLSNDELREIVREFEAIRSNHKFLFQAMSWIYGRHAFGRGHFVRFFERGKDSDYLNVIAYWSVVRADFVSKAIGERERAKSGLPAALAADSAEFQNLLATNPDLARILTPEILRRFLETAKNKADLIRMVQILVFSRLAGVIKYKGQMSGS